MEYLPKIATKDFFSTCAGKELDNLLYNAQGIKGLDHTLLDPVRDNVCTVVSKIAQALIFCVLALIDIPYLAISYFYKNVIRPFIDCVYNTPILGNAFFVITEKAFLCLEALKFPIRLASLPLIAIAYAIFYVVDQIIARIPSPTESSFILNLQRALINIDTSFPAVIELATLGPLYSVLAIAEWFFRESWQWINPHIDKPPTIEKSNSLDKLSFQTMTAVLEFLPREVLAEVMMTSRYFAREEYYFHLKFPPHLSIPTSNLIRRAQHGRGVCDLPDPRVLYIHQRNMLYLRNLHDTPYWDLETPPNMDVIETELIHDIRRDTPRNSINKEDFNQFVTEQLTSKNWNKLKLAMSHPVASTRSWKQGFSQSRYPTISFYELGDTPVEQKETLSRFFGITNTTPMVYGDHLKWFIEDLRAGLNPLPDRDELLAAFESDIRNTNSSPRLSVNDFSQHVIKMLKCQNWDEIRRAMSHPVASTRSWKENFPKNSYSAVAAHHLGSTHVEQKETLSLFFNITHTVPMVYGDHLSQFIDELLAGSNPLPDS